MDKLYIAKLMYHKWEEEPISGIERGYKGTFAIFFYGCNLHCIYCQNSKISRVKVSDLVETNNMSAGASCMTPSELADKLIEAEKNGAATVSFITGVWYRKLIIETIRLAKEKGLTIPIVYNSSGYEFDYHIRELDGLIDIYLPDFKYYDSELGKKYSKVSNYPDIAKSCIAEMYRQVKDNVIVRNLVLPGHTEDSKNVLRYLYDTYGNGIYYSIMSQYTPMDKNEELKEYKELMRKLTKREYNKVVDFAMEIGIKNAFIQEGDTTRESFIPDF